MLNDINNFIKWLAVKTLIITKVSSATKITSVFVFLFESHFLCCDWVCSSIKMILMFFIHFGKVCNILHHLSAGWVKKKEWYLMFSDTFFTYFLSFYLLISFLDEASNFHNWTLTNKKQELVLSDFWWTCMHFSFKYNQNNP